MCGAVLKPSTWLANPARGPRPRIIRGYPPVQGRHLNPQHRVFIYFRSFEFSSSSSPSRAILARSSRILNQFSFHKILSAELFEIISIIHIEL